MKTMPMLSQTKVQFNEEQHTYTLDGKTLSGITSLIHKYIFPDMYSDVNPEVLQKAAERGKRIHNLIQLYFMDLLSEDDKAELQPFFDATRDIDFIASEYLVSDEQQIASSIDLVAKSGDNISLYDVKTTATLNIEYLQWQLSIYAYLFEMQNRDMKVINLYAIHFRDNKCKLVEIQRLPNEYILALINAYEQHSDTFDNPLHKLSDDFHALLRDFSKIEIALAELEAEKKPLDERKKQLQEQIAAALSDKGLNKLETDTAKISVGSDTTRETFDLKAFRKSELYGEQFNQFIKSTTVKGRITITLKQ